MQGFLAAHSGLYKSPSASGALGFNKLQVVY